MKNYTKNMNTMNHSQKGFSLLEVLISMVIGLFLLIGITSSYVASKKSSLVRSEISILEDTGRSALEVLRESLQHAGYRSTELFLIDNPFITETPENAKCSDGSDSLVGGAYSIPAGITDYIIDNDAGDSVGVFFMGDASVNNDCGSDVLAEACQASADVDDSDAHKVYSTFYVNTDDELVCSGSLSSEVILADGIENIQILYGMDIDEDSAVERYVNATDVGDDWGMVVSMQIAILVRASSGTKDTAESITYSLLDTSVSTGPDRFERAVFSTSIDLRNL